MEDSVVSNGKWSLEIYFVASNNSRALVMMVFYKMEQDSLQLPFYVSVLED